MSASSTVRRRSAGRDDTAVSQSSPESIPPSDAVPQHVAVPGVTNTACTAGHVLVHVILFDVVFWLVMFCRDYSTMSNAQMTIAHYLAVLPFTDFPIALLLEASRMPWFHVFRGLECLQIGALTFNLWWFGVDDPLQKRDWLTALRLAACAARLLHSIFFAHEFIFMKSSSDASSSSWLAAVYRRVFLLKSDDGEGDDVIPLQEEFAALFAHLRGVMSPLPSNELVSGLAFILFANTASSTHNAFGESRVLGPLTGFQAGDAVTLFLKLFVMDRLFGDQHFGCRAVVYASLALSLIVQWPWMPAMFTHAPLPIVHIGAEIGTTMSAYARWKLSK